MTTISAQVCGCCCASDATVLSTHSRLSNRGSAALASNQLPASVKELNCQHIAPEDAMATPLLFDPSSCGAAAPADSSCSADRRPISTEGAHLRDAEAIAALCPPTAVCMVSPSSVSAHANSQHTHARGVSGLRMISKILPCSTAIILAPQLSRDG